MLSWATWGWLPQFLFCPHWWQHSLWLLLSLTLRFFWPQFSSTQRSDSSLLFSLISQTKLSSERKQDIHLHMQIGNEPKLESEIDLSPRASFNLINVSSHSSKPSLLSFYLLQFTFPSLVMFPLFLSFCYFLPLFYHIILSCLFVPSV